MEVVAIAEIVGVNTYFIPFFPCPCSGPVEREKGIQWAVSEVLPLLKLDLVTWLE